MASKSSYLELDGEELQALTDDRIITSTPPRPGKRRVSNILLSFPGSEGSSSSNSSSPAVSVRPISFKTFFDSTFDLPEALRGVPALEFIGFTKEMATKIYHRWVGRPDPDHNPDDLIDYVYGDTSQFNVEHFRSYPPIEAMTRLGLSRDFQDAILDPLHSAVYGTQTLHYWVNDTLRINYLTLELLQDRLKDYAGKSVAKKKKGKLSKLETPFQSAAASSSGPGDRIPRTATLNMESKNYHLPPDWVATQEADPILPNHYVLYKAKAAAEMREDQ